MKVKNHYQILIIGGGTAGIMVAARLKNQHPKADIAIIEPSEKHFYQPAWTLVGGGTYHFKDTIRPEASLIPKGVHWIKDYAESVEPEQNEVSTRNNGCISYQFLVVCPGLQMDTDALEGLPEALETDSVCSNYINPEKTWQVLKKFKGGNAVFTQPSTPIKCGGAPQKIMYLAEEHFRKTGVRAKTQVVFATSGSVIFGVKDFADTLNKIIAERDILLKTFYAPVKIDSTRKEIHFRNLLPEGVIPELDPRIKEYIANNAHIIMPYDMLHTAPPQSAPDFIKKSVLAVQEGPLKGWMDVDINTLQHLRYTNVFGLGDVAALPTAKTGAAIRKQAPVVAEMLNLLLNGQPTSKLQQKYEGYSSCPLVTGYGKMVLAEFKYNNVRDSDKLISSFIDTTKEQWSMWLLKKYGLPWLYWNRMMQGKM